MKRLFLILIVTSLLVGCVHAGEKIEINDAEFELPAKYSGGESDNDSYELDDTFSIRCIDKNVPKAIGLWASECDSSEDLNIAGHPVRHFCQYNEHVHGNQSHAYFVSGDSVYEIVWTESEIDGDIKKVIESTPQSEIADDDFYSGLDVCLDIYKEQRKEQLNRDGEYNYLEAKYKSQSGEQPQDDTRFKEILFTYYVNR
jgi:hypothetical protein